MFSKRFPSLPDYWGNSPRRKGLRGTRVHHPSGLQATACEGQGAFRDKIALVPDERSANRKLGLSVRQGVPEGHNGISRIRITPLFLRI